MNSCDLVGDTTNNLTLERDVLRRDGSVKYELVTPQFWNFNWRKGTFIGIFCIFFDNSAFGMIIHVNCNR